MEDTMEIFDFIQHLYENYRIAGGIEYGYNESSETHIVRICDERLSSDEKLLDDITRFSTCLAEKGKWIVFVFPNDVLKFPGLKKVAKSHLAFPIENLQDFRVGRLFSIGTGRWVPGSNNKRAENYSVDSGVEADAPYYSFAA